MTVSGPFDDTPITEAYVRMAARGAYFWAWPLINKFRERARNSGGTL
jgi:hypothetical protein